jgi:pimeloyl-ACP methyl ester carboxylesterase
MDRLSHTKLQSLLAEVHDKKLRKSLEMIADESTFLDPLSAEISADPPPDQAEQLRMLTAAADYLGRVIPTLPNFFATRTAVYYREVAPYPGLNMPPDAPYPAGLDDAMKVWKATAKTHDPRKMAIFGSSAGGGMALAMILRAREENLPLPAAIAIGTPWADLTETGDTYKTNEWLDNIIVSYRGYLSRAARLYANGHDLKDPHLSPIYGDFHGFPPTVLTSGTRDLFLSLTVLTHRKLRRSNVEAELNVFEGMSHIHFILNPYAPESREAFTDWARFLDKHLGH